VPSPISEHTVPWPAADAARYAAAGYWAGIPLGTLLRSVADQRAAVPAVTDPVAGARLTHGELADRADAAAGRLLDLGLAPGDRIVVQLPNGWEFPVLLIACLRAGIVPVLALPAHRRAELSYLAIHAEASAIAVPGRLRDFDHQAMARDLGPEVRAATGGPWHVLVAGGAVIMLPSPEPRRAFAAIEAEGVTHTAVVPAVAGRWLEHATSDGTAAGRLASLRVLQVGGARLADELARRIEPVLGCRLQQVFGMAEGLLNYTRLDDPAEVITSNQGRPLSPADEVRIVDELDQDVPPGQPGALLTRGPYTPRGYYRAPEHNTRSFTPDGWYRSGDICRQAPGGNLIVEGRDKDMINRGGEKISAEEVENLVYRVGGVSQVAAVAMPDPVLGERLCLYVVPVPGVTPTLAEIRRSMEGAGIAGFKLPEHLVLTGELPVTKVGKIDKKALRADIASAPPSPAASNEPGRCRRNTPAMHGPRRARLRAGSGRLAAMRRRAGGVRGGPVSPRRRRPRPRARSRSAC
jgi:non-ribosomal peptide synthetase component E (peptide arylation enzyme)